MLEDVHVQHLDLNLEMDRRLLSNFLQSHDLTYEADIDAAFGIFDRGDTLLGCGCAAGDLLKCFAIRPELRGQNGLGMLLSALIQNRYAAGYYNLFVITRNDNEMLFRSCGLHTVARTDHLVMLETQPNGPERFLQPFIEPVPSSGMVGSIVMNCNPFTKGHRALIEYASNRCSLLHLFVVEEDRSYFSTQVRLRLVREGTADLSNVRVHLSGHYMISRATFPTYFLKRDEDGVRLQAELDAVIFAERIAPVLTISSRFVGQEPLDPVTNRYNQTLSHVLPQHGIRLIEISRAEQDGEIISASRVRALLKEKGVCQEALDLVPPATQKYLLTEYQGEHP